MVNITRKQTAEEYVDAGALFVSKLRDPVSCLTHLTGAAAALLFTPVLLVHAWQNGASGLDMAALGIFMFSMILMYSASATYHGLRLEGSGALVTKRFDHACISLLIAGTYTPICVCAMKEKGTVLLCVVWALALAAIAFKMFWVTCPRWISSVIYIAMGWAVVFAMPTLLESVSTSMLTWLYAGGVIYTVGGVIYALKLIRFNSRGSMWGSHEIFHLFVMAGSICHYVCIYLLFG